LKLEKILMIYFKQKNDTNFSLSIDDTQIIKGVAICLMLWHHLFLWSPEYGSFVLWIAQFGKVCVSLFLFVSAYGLTVQYNKIFDKPITSTFKFQMKRFVKFYANYWVIFLIVVPIGVFILGRSLNIPYENSNVIKSTITDFLAMNGYRSYNVIWWFNRLIVCLYFLFPILYFITKRWTILFLTGLVFLLLLLRTEMPIWTLQFVLGIAFALYINQLNRFLNRFNFWILLSILLFVFSILFYLRNAAIIPFFTDIKVDTFQAVTIILMVLLIIRRIHAFNSTLKFLGKHSMNMYMIHMFICYYFFKNFTYSFKYPLLIFTVLLAICLIISMIIEYGKKIAGLPVLIKKINTKIENNV